MSNKESNSSPLDEIKQREDQEQLSQQALGNTEAVENEKLSDNNDLLSKPITTGTGSNPAAAAPNSLIVNEEAHGEDRYEAGETDAEIDKK